MVLFVCHVVLGVIYYMNSTRKFFLGIDLFAGAGGLSLGAKMAGVNVAIAIEKDKHAAATYAHNHRETNLILDDIRNVKSIEFCHSDATKILFGGPPCQGYSTSNQRTRNKDNPSNWMFEEFLRFVKIWEPQWVLFENVKGIGETEGGYFRDELIDKLSTLGYQCSYAVLCASSFGVPQKRSRFILIASSRNRTVDLSGPDRKDIVTVKEAIEDLPLLENGAIKDTLYYRSKPISSYAKLLRGNMESCTGNLVTKNSDQIIERYKHIPQGGNWQDIPTDLMSNYKDQSRCHTGIYYRLKEDEPALTLGNYRKSMLIHPWQNRGLSVREAARIQSFPDDYIFMGSIGFQQQQVGNAVPPLFAKALFDKIIEMEMCTND